MNDPSLTRLRLPQPTITERIAVSEPVILVQTQDQALRLTLNRPRSMNALTPDLLDVLTAQIESARTRRDICCVVITGAGPAFCAGVDLRDAREQFATGWSGIEGVLRRVSNCIESIAALPMPVVASVNGLALAGGLELVLACDLVIAARSARFGDVHANHGLVPGAGASFRLPRKIGVSRAKYLALTGRTLSAEDLQQAGLVNQVVDDADLACATADLVGSMASKSRTGLQRIKALIDLNLEQPASGAARLEMLMSEITALGPDLREGLAAFDEKRAPKFDR